MGTPNKVDKQRSAITRCIRFIYWCSIRGILKTIFPWITLSPIGVIYMFAMYALRPIKSSTVTKYIGDIGNFLRHFADDTSLNVKNWQQYHSLNKLHHKRDETI